MSHHGNYNEQESAAMRALMEQMVTRDQKQLQGEFPSGRLNVNDEGAVAVGIGHQQGKVVMSFPHPTTWIGFTPEQAFDMAESLIEHARACGFKRPLTLKIGG